MTSGSLFRFYDELGRLYPEEKFVHKSAWGLARRRFLKKLLHQYFQGEFLVDVGCGGGILLQMMEQFGAKKLVGIDIAHLSLIRARQVTKYAFLICADAEIIPIADGVADCVLCTETLEHLERPEKFFREASRIIGENGILIVTCPNWHGHRPYEVDVGILRHFGIKHDKYIHTAFTPAELEALAKANGFEVIESGSFEKEMRIWGRIYDSIWHLIFMLLETLHSPDKIIVFAYRLQCWIGGILYWIIEKSGLGFFLRKIFSRGPRSYIVAVKRF